MRAIRHTVMVTSSPPVPQALRLPIVRASHATKVEARATTEVMKDFMFADEIVEDGMQD